MAGSRDKKAMAPEQIREIKEALDYLSGRIESVAKEMESRSIPKISVKKFKTLIKSKALVIGCATAFQEGLDTAVTDTSAWELPAASPPAPSPTPGTVLHPPTQDAAEEVANAVKSLGSKGKKSEKEKAKK